MKKGANSIRRKELKKDNVEKFRTYFFEKKNTTGTLFVHACYKVGGNTGLPLVSDAQLLGGTIPRKCSFQNQIFERQIRGPSIHLDSPSPISALVNHQTAKSTDPSLLVPPRNTFTQ